MAAPLRRWPRAPSCSGPAWEAAARAAKRAALQSDLPGFSPASSTLPRGPSCLPQGQGTVTVGDGESDSVEGLDGAQVLKSVLAAVVSALSDPTLWALPVP